MIIFSINTLLCRKCTQSFFCQGRFTMIKEPYWFLRGREQLGAFMPCIYCHLQPHALKFFTSNVCRTAMLLTTLSIINATTAQSREITTMFCHVLENTGTPVYLPTIHKDVLMCIIFFLSYVKGYTGICTNNSV